MNRKHACNDPPTSSRLQAPSSLEDPREKAQIIGPKGPVCAPFVARSTPAEPAPPLSTRSCLRRRAARRRVARRRCPSRAGRTERAAGHGRGPVPVSSTQPHTQVWLSAVDRWLTFPLCSCRGAVYICDMPETSNLSQSQMRSIDYLIGYPNLNGTKRLCSCCSFRLFGNGRCKSVLGLNKSS